jgi:hypothetical protein
MSHALVDSLNYIDLISGKWDVNTCIRFLMLSETTQKRLPGAPQPPRPCAVKDIVCRRLFFFFSIVLNNNNKSQVSASTSTAISSVTSSSGNNNNSSSDNFLTTIVNTLNLQLLIIRHTFPSYHKVILPLQATTSPASLNASIKNTQHQLLEMFTWLNTRNCPQLSGGHTDSPFVFLQGQAQHSARIDRYFE